MYVSSSEQLSIEAGEQVLEPGSRLESQLGCVTLAKDINQSVPEENGFNNSV